MLNSIGLIKYDKILQCKLHEKKLIESKEESEIRAASIIACEKLKNLLNCCCNAVELDYYLWVIHTITNKQSYKQSYLYICRNTLKGLKMNWILFTLFIGLVPFIINKIFSYKECPCA